MYKYWVCADMESYHWILGFLCFPIFFRQSQDELTNIIASIHPKVGLQY